VKTRFNTFVQRIKMLTSTGPISFREFSNLYLELVLGVEPSEDLKININHLAVPAPLLESIEQLFMQNKEDYCLTQHFYRLLRFTRTNMSQQTLDYLHDCALRKELAPLSIFDFTTYLLFNPKDEYCEFFKKIIDRFVEEKNYLAGYMAVAAASLNCTNCIDSIKKILASEDRNPWMHTFAQEAFDTLRSKRLNE